MFLKALNGKYRLILKFLIILTALQLSGCEERSKRFGGPFTVSPDGKKIAMTIGTDRRWGDSTPWILQLCNGDTKLIPLQGLNLTQGMAWRPGAFPPELFVIASNRGGHQRIVGVRISERTVSTIVSQEVPDIFIHRLVWNPSGEIFAVFVAKYGDGGVTGIYLGLCFDNGKNINVTDIPVSGTKFIWIDNETLYIEYENSILEVNISKGKAHVKSTFVSAEGLWLVASLDGKIVYTLGNEIYCGAQLLYKSNEQIGRILANGSYLVFKENDKMVVLDGKGNVIHEKRIGEDSIHIGISPTHKLVYLLENQRSIKQYSFIDSDTMSTVYELKH